MGSWPAPDKAEVLHRARRLPNEIRAAVVA